MTDDIKLKNAMNVYNSLCEMLDEKAVAYEKHPEDLVITFNMNGDDLPMRFIINTDPIRELIRLLSPIPVIFDEDKRELGAVATSMANYRLADGSFDFDYRQGRVIFRMTSSFIDSLISKKLLEYMIAVAGLTIDDYNDKLRMLAKGHMSLEEFISKI